MCRTIINDNDNLIAFNFSREKLFKKVFFFVFFPKMFWWWNF